MPVLIAILTRSLQTRMEIRWELCLVRPCACYFQVNYHDQVLLRYRWRNASWACIEFWTDASTAAGTISIASVCF
jgi:hypothetical protein